jgi:imidazolonepropionase-like amidohydrolase
MGGHLWKILMTHKTALATMLPACLVAMYCALPAMARDRVAAQADLYYNFTLVDPATEKRVENAWVVVEAGRLSRIGSGRPPKASDPARVHDLSGRFVMPGLIDAHAHITATGILKVEVKDGAPVLSMKIDPAITQRNARAALSRGVTTVRNPAGNPEENAQYDRMITSGAWIGPEARHAGAAVEPPPFGGEMFVYPRTEAEWQAEASRQARLGMTYFKLYMDLNEQELATGIRVAHEHGLQAIAHLNNVSWTRAAELGIDGLEHALPTSPDLLEPEARARYLAERDMTSRFMYRWFELADFNGPLIRGMVELLAREKIPVNLTLVVNELVYNTDDLARVLPRSQLKDFHPDVHEVYESQLRASAAGWTPEDYERARAVMPKVLAFARMLHEAGVPMMIGTDAGGGVMIDREMQLHREAGIPLWDVLRMVTSGTADIMKMGDRIGRIKEGYEADLAIFDADPVADVRATAQVYGVINNGTLLRAEELMTAARGTPTLTDW